MAKLQVYKFVNPGSTNNGNLAIAAARTQTLALNRLGASVESLGRIVLDIQKVGTLNSAAVKATALSEKRNARLQRDAAAEAAQESKKASEKEAKPGEFGSAIKKTAKKSVSWVDKFLGPIGSFLLSIAGFVAVKEMMAWAADPKNKEELQTFVERADFVIRKIYNIGKTLVGNVLDGFTDLFGKDKSFGERLSGLGKLMMGIIGLKYLMNPFSLISDIMSLFELMNQNVPGGDKPGRKPPTKPGSTQPASRPSASTRATNSRIRAVQRSHGPAARQIYENALRNGKSPSQAQAAVARALQRGQIVSRPAASSLAASSAPSGQILKGGVSRTANRFGLKLFGKAGMQSLKGIFGRIPIIGPLMVAIGSILSGEPIGQTLFKTFGAAVGGFLGSFIPIPILGTLLGETIGTYVGDLLYTLFMGGGVEAVGNKLKQDMLKVLETGKIVTDWVGRGLGRYFDGVPKVNIFGKKVPDIFWLINPLNVVDKFKKFHRAFFTDIPMNETKEQEKKRLEKEKKERAELAKKLKAQEAGHNNPDTGYTDIDGDGVISEWEKVDLSARGGPVTIPRAVPEMGLGGFFQSVSQGISNVVSGVGKAVSSVVSNPIVQTAASFIPGAAPIMATIGAVSGLASGNPLGALASGIGMIPGVSGILGGISSAIGSPLGQVGMSLLNGNIGGAISAGLGMIPGLGGTLGSIVNQGVGFALGTGPGGASDLIGSIAGTLANQFNLGGLYKAITGFMGGNYSDGMSQLAGELGVDPKYLGVTRTAAGLATQALSKEGLSAKYAMEQTLELVPVPVIIEKLVPMPTAVPINTGGGTQVVSAGPSNLTQRTQ